MTTISREVFGIVSADATRGYTVFDGSTVADTVVQGLRDAGLARGTKAEITYDAPTTRYQIRAIVPAPVEIPDHRGVGRLSSLYLDISGRDDGMGRISGAIGAIVFRCMNASLAQTEGSRWSRVHKGNMDEIRALVAGMSSQFASVAADLHNVWSRAAANHYLDSETGLALSVPEAIERLISTEQIPTGGMDPVVALDYYRAAWRAEGSPASAAGVIDTLTRAAHESTWSTKWVTTEIESAASDLLYQSVYTLPSIEA
jgi:hypothetical protein